MKQFLPILQWLPGYNRKNITGDLSAGLTVGVMLIPQGMAYAMLAGLPPIYGLYAALYPILVYAIFGTSRQLAVGPVAMVSLLVASGVGKIAETGTENFMALAILLALIVGLIQLVLGIARLGFLVNFLSHPVISGFTSAAALIIGINQLKHLLGVDIPRSSQLYETVYHIGYQLPSTHVPTFLVGLLAIALILLARRLNKTLPGPLIAVVLGILAVYVLSLDSLGVGIIKEVPAGLPGFTSPAFSWYDIQGLFPTALTIALVGFIESIAVAKAIQSKHKDYKLDANQELIGLGLANIIGSFFKSFPVTGGFSRTAVNDQAGAKTSLASIISAILILFTLLFLTPLFYYLPKAILASVIIVAVLGLIDLKEAVHLWKRDKKDFYMLLITFIATLILGVEKGVALGVVLSLVLVVFRSSYPHVAVLGKIPGTNSFRNVNRYPEAVEVEGVLIVRFDAQLFFANSSYFKDFLEVEIAKRKNLKLLIINAQAINSMDSSAIHMLSDLLSELQTRHIQLAFAGLQGPVRDIMLKNEFVEKLGPNHFFNEIQEVLENFDGSILNNKNGIEFQSNVTDEV